MSILFSHEGRLTTASLDTGRLDLPRDTRVFRSCLDHGRSVWTRSGQQPARSCFQPHDVGDWLGGERSGAERREPERSPDASALPPLPQASEPSEHEQSGAPLVDPLWA